MKLEPLRGSLSGRPEFLREKVAAVPVQAAPLPRKCCECGLVDALHDFGDEKVNSVAVELKFIDAPNEVVAKQRVTANFKAHGWQYRIHLGRHAMVRDICRPCMEAHREIQKEFKAKKAAELNSSLNSESYYLALCGD